MDMIMDSKLAMPLTGEAVLRTAETVERLSFLGVTVEVLVGSESTGGAWSLITFAAPARFRGPSPHRHAAMTETVYVLSGKLLFHLDGMRMELEAGDKVVAPPGLVHCYSNPYDVPARLLIHCAPGGYEGFFREVAAVVARAPTWPPVDLAGLAVIAEKYDTFGP
jgi:quercetin dioxygenase-like cupin family protein